MLENNFNELDNDFVTIWSRYIVNHDEAQIMNDLEKLAELGQINAIQSYYLILGLREKAQTNSTIDRKLEENAVSRNFNYILAEANKNYALNSKQLHELMKEHDEKVDEINELDEEYRHAVRYENYNLSERLERQIDNADDELEEKKEEIKHHPVVAKETEAIKSCYAQAKETQNPYVKERYFELATGTHASYFLEKDERKFNNAIKQTQKELARRFKTNPDPQTAYALGKSLVFFGKKEKSKQMGIEILTKLAERPLSKTLTSYINHGIVNYGEENKSYLDLE